MLGKAHILEGHALGGLVRSTLKVVITVLLCFPSGLAFAQSHLPDQPSLTALKRTAESGSMEAQAKLGAMYMDGDGVPKDVTAGFRWSYQAALAGSNSAARRVSSAYWSGSGVPQNPAAAFDWARIAAVRADPDAQGGMIFYYLKGVGVHKDVTMAYAWALVLRASGAKRSSSTLASWFSSLRPGLVEDQKSEASSLATAWMKSKDHVMPVHSLWYLNHLPEKKELQANPQTILQSRGCSSGHWLSDKMDDGKYLRLEDDSLWEVDDVDILDSALWLETDEITICAGKLINTDEKESVGAKRIK